MMAFLTRGGRAIAARRSTVIALACLIATAAAGCAAPEYGAGGPLDPGRLAVVRGEVAARAAAASAAAGAARRWGGAELAEMFDRLARAAVPVCAASSVECRFRLRLADDPDEDANAYASGEGDVTVTRPLLDLLARPDEVAFVLAHEIGHHLGRHLDEGRAAAGGGALVGGLLLGALTVIAGGDPYVVEDAVDLGSGLGALGARRRYGLAAETEADYLGAYLAARAGYDPAAGRGVMLAFAALEGGGRLDRGLFASHPSGPERIVANERAVAEIAAKRARGEPLLPSRRRP